MNGIRKQPVGPANRVAADDPFYMPVITGNISVREESAQVFLLVEGISMKQRTWRNPFSVEPLFLTVTKTSSRIYFIWLQSCLPSKTGSSQKKTSQFPEMALLSLSMQTPLTGNQSIRKIQRNPSTACAIIPTRMFSGDGTALKKTGIMGVPCICSTAETLT